jgi:hypothetical protein
MGISLAESRSNSFRKCSIAHPPGSNNDGQPGGDTPIALTATDLDDPIMAPPEQPHRPWLVPGVGRQL